MRKMIFLIILLALSVSFTWGQEGHGVYPLAHYQVIDTTVDSMLWLGRWVPDSSKPNNYVQELVWIKDTTINTVWRKKIPVYLRPDEYKRLMEMLEYPKIDTHHITGGQWIPIQSDSFGLFDSAFKKADKEFEWWLSEDSAFWDSIINHMKKED